MPRRLASVAATLDLPLIGEPIVKVGVEPPTQGLLPALDLSLCENEPIHAPGAIQPHGAVLAALADGLLVTHASANLFAILGRPVEAVLGRLAHER
jgi:hypothetical protein